MPQSVPAALVAPTRPGLTDVGYLVRSASSYSTILTNWTAVAEAGSSTGYYPVQGTISVPDAGCLIEFRRASNTGTFLSAVTVEPVPSNFTDMAITASTGQVTVGTLASNSITAAVIATDAIDADAIAADAVTEIQAGLATQASVNAIPTTPAPTAAQNAAATWTYTTGDRLLTGSQATEIAKIQGIRDKTDALPSDPADQSLLIDAINTRASQTSVNAIPITTAPTAAQVATAVEAALLLDGDGQALLTAIREAVATLFDSGADVSVTTLVDAIAAKITADHGAGSYLTPNLSALALEATAQAIKAKTDTISGQGLTQAEKDKLNELWQRAGLDLTNPVTRVQTGAVVTETFGAVEIEISNTTPNTVTSTRQPNA